MSNPKYTRKSNQSLVLMRIDGAGWAARDSHLTIGKGSGSHSNYTGRAQVHFPEPDWPAIGRMVDARITTRESGTGAHGDFRGSSPRLWMRRLSEKPGYSVPDTADGYYTQQGSGDRYPGSTTAGTEVEYSVSGTDTHSVAAMVEAMLPTRIKKRNGQPGGNALWGHFQIRSSDEDSASRSFILSTDLTLVVEVKTAVTPDAPLIMEVTGAQEGPGGPTIVGSTDGRTLEVAFAFVGAPGDTCSRAELELRSAGATDGPPVTGSVVRTTGSITPAAGGGAGVYRVRLTGLDQGAEGRFRVRTTSQKGEQGDWTSLDDDDSHVRLATIPGPPLDIVFQPFASDPHVLGTLNSADPADYLTGAEVEVTALPDGITLYAPGPEEIGGTSRRSDTNTNLDLQPGQVVSFRLRHRNSQQVWGQWSAPRTQTVREAQAVTFSPAPGRLTSLTPTITLTFPLADGARLRLLDPLDDSRVVYDSGATVLVNQTSNAFAVPAGKLAYGQRVNAVGSYVPDGGGTTYTAESEPITYTAPSLPVTVLSVPDAVNRRVGVADIEWLRTVTDPDGAAIASIEQEIRVAATPRGSGALVVTHTDTTATALRTIPGGSVAYETSVDSRARATNDAGTGPWSPWLTITALQPPAVDLISPADAAVVTNPTQTLDWSVTGYGGRTQASATVTIYDAAGAVLGDMAVTTPTIADIPAYLLDDATAYGWDVTVTDSLGMVTTSTRRTFTTLFAEPLPISVLSAEADPDSGTVVLSWDEGAEPYLHNIEVTWIADDGSPVRIDGGPESLLDGNTPFTGTTLTHIGARLGENVYHVAVSNGWRSSEPVSASATLTQPTTNRGSWHLVADGVFIQLRSLDQPIVTEGIIERMQAPGGQPREIAWGLAARRISMTVDIRPTVDGSLSTTLRGLMADARAGRPATPVWLKPPAGWLWDPLWVTLQSFTDSPGTGGRTRIATDWLEIGDPVHAIMPVVLGLAAVGAGDIAVDAEALDFGVRVQGS